VDFIKSPIEAMSATQGTASASRHAAYQLFMLGLCIYALGALVVQSVLNLDSETNTLLEYADFAVCLIFFGDFVVQLTSANNRWRYFRRWGWLDLISSIPMIPAFRIGRAARVVRVIRILRGARSSKILAELLLAKRAESAFLAASLLSLVLIIFSSVAVLQFESSKGNIQTAGDALWWSVVTLATVGYGDHYPITQEGRAIAVVLMFGGVALIGTLSGFAASWFLNTPRSNKESMLPIEKELQSIRSEISTLSKQLRELVDQSGHSGKT
jgi:voltage-gated potassium channel